MQYIVLKPFKTPVRRLREGVLINDSDVDGPLSALEWADRGYLGPVPVADEDLTALRDEATSLGVEFDRRWGAQRLRDAIEAQKAADRATAEAMAREAEEAAQATSAEADRRAADAAAGKPEK